VSDTSELRALAADIAGDIATIEVRAGLVLDKTTFDVVATAQQIVAVDTGATKGSIHATVVGPLEREAGPTTEYAHFLEGGTSRMSPLPFMFPSLDKHTPAFLAGMGQVGELRL
jgi:hypothetical protein